MMHPPKSPIIFSSKNTNLDDFGCSLKCYHLLQEIDDKTLEKAENDIIKLLGGIRSVIKYYVNNKNISLNEYDSLFSILNDINPPPSSESIVKPNLGYLPNEILSKITNYLNIIDLRSFQLINVSFALLGRLYSNTLNAKLYRSKIQNFEIKKIMKVLLKSNYEIIKYELNTINHENKMNAKQLCENGIIYKIITFIKSNDINPSLKKAAIQFIGKITNFYKIISYNNDNKLHEECYYIYMKELIQHNAIKAFYDQKYPYFFFQKSLVYNIYCNNKPIWECNHIQLFRKINNEWRNRGKGIIRIYNIENNGYCLKLLTFLDTERNIVGLMQYLNECRNHKSYPIINGEEDDKYESFGFKWNINNKPLHIFSFRFNESERMYLDELSMYFDQESDDKELLNIDHNEWTTFSYIEYDHIFCYFYLLPIPLKTAVIQILSNDMDENMEGIKFIASMLRANEITKQSIPDELHNLMKTGIVLKIIELLKCKTNVQLQWFAVDVLANIASMNDEFTNIISIFGGIEVLNELLIKQHCLYLNEENEYEMKDTENDDDDKDLLEAVIWTIGNISGTSKCRIKLNEYKIFNEIIGNILKYQPKVQCIATWTMTHIFDDKEDINSDIIDSIQNISEILLKLLKSANINDDNVMCLDILFCLKQYVNQSDEVQANKACFNMVKSGFLSYLLDYIHILLFETDEIDLDETCLLRALFILYSIIDQIRICENTENEYIESESETESVSFNWIDFKETAMNNLLNKKFFEILSHSVLLSHEENGWQYIALWFISNFLSENNTIIQWMIDLNNSSILKFIINVIQKDEFNDIEIKNESYIIITSIIQQIVNEKQIESLIKIGIIEAIFIMMDNVQNIIECIYCMDIIYRLTKHNDNNNNMISSYILKLDELLLNIKNKKSNQRIIRKIKSTKQHYINLCNK